MNYTILTTYPDSVTEAKWERFLRRATFPTHYVTPNFFIDPFIRGGEKFVVLVFDDSQEIVAVLSGVQTGKKITSGFAVRPQTAFRKDIDIASPAKAMLAGLEKKGGDDLELIEFHTWEPICEFEELGFETELSSGSNLVIMLDLDAGPDAIFKDFSQTRRNELRKVMKANVLDVKRLETEAELRELYDIHVDWNHRKGNTPDSFENMKLAADQTDNRLILIAKHDGKVVAGSYYRFCAGGVIEYAANNSLPEFQKLRPNDLLGWRSIEWACENGFSHYSMGGSHLFLRRFGGAAVSTYRYRLDRTFLKLHNNRERVSRLAVKTYQSLPESVRHRIKTVTAKV